MHNFETKYQSIVYAVMTNKELTDDERSKIIADFFDEFKNSYPNLEHNATKQELSQTELRLTKEIESVRLEIKEVEANLQKDMKEIEANLQKEIESVRLEIKEVEANLQKEIGSVRLEIKESQNTTIKWVAGMLFVQVIALGGLFLAAFKLFGTH